MITCEAISNQLSQYHDNDLSRSEKARFEKHLLTCMGCRETVRRFNKLSGALMGYQMATAPDDFLKQLHERMRQEGLSPKKRAEAIGAPRVMADNLMLTAEELIKASKEAGVPISYSALRKYIKLGILPRPEKRGQYIGYYESSAIEKIKMVREILKKSPLGLLDVKELIERQRELKAVLKLFMRCEKEIKTVVYFLKKGLSPDEIETIINDMGCGREVEDVSKLKKKYKKSKILFLTHDPVAQLKRFRDMRKDELKYLEELIKNFEEAGKD